MLGPVTPEALGEPLGLARPEVTAALLVLEAEGVALRGSFTPGTAREEWCDRRLLARIHRHTLDRLRAEIEPATPADFMRFLFAWQHAAPAHQTSGLDGLRAVVLQLDGFELAAGAWERRVLPARISGYEPSMLDLLCFSGELGWGRLRPAGRRAAADGVRPVSSCPIALFVREHGMSWRALAGADSGDALVDGALGERAARVLGCLRGRGASFVHEIAMATTLDVGDVHAGLAELVHLGWVTSDGFAGLRAVLARRRAEPRITASYRSRRAVSAAFPAGGRWSLFDGGPLAPRDREADVECQARALLRRYGVVFRRLLAREPATVSWRELAITYRRLEARGEIRGGRFVSGMSGEQFALPDAVSLLRGVRRACPTGACLAISAADPLNLVGIVTAGERVAAVARSRIVYRDGVPLAVLERGSVRTLGEMDASLAQEAARALGVPTAALRRAAEGRTPAPVAV
jgi:ATP-dependent Lhr-like helicase